MRYPSWSLVAASVLLFLTACDPESTANGNIPSPGTVKEEASDREEYENEATIQSGIQEDVNGVDIGVSVSETDAHIDVVPADPDDRAPGDRDAWTVEGPPGHSETVPNGYTITIVDIDPPEDAPDETAADGGAGGSVTVGVERPDEE